MDITVFKNNLDQYIIERYGKCYVSKIQLTETPDDDMFIYNLKLDLNNHDKPLSIMGQFRTQEDFQDYVFNEIDSKRLNLTQYFRLYNIEQLSKKTPIHDEAEITPNLIVGPITYPFLYGSSNTVIPNDQLYNELIVDNVMRSRTYIISANKEYLYFAYPQSLGKLTSVMQNSFNVINAFELSSVLINSGHWEKSYYVYKTIDKTTAVNQSFILDF